ncbi:plasmid rolling circle replication initiator protein [Cylindrospermum stagnale PCC 7417]|uniref:Plasmid rolling circle replication initiator protein n=1 Tax=Cylindrospermum stagnale PCC 7417 TaxID=56107 RepID=K9WWP1_9NOST|nr:protein rep [Cylindrospermum stagnale]AFZ24206.1 plasmid rolling circle replication initiator protein [Cylindrospermum stagnale PCC 7417]
MLKPNTLREFVSAQASDKSVNISSLEKYQQSQNILSLTEVSPIGKTWEKHRNNADQVSEYYAKSGDDAFNEYAWRLRTCSDWLEFRLVPAESTDILNFKLANARFCRVRHCPVCQWRRSLMWKAKAYKVLPQVVTDYPKYRWLFITLTVRNCKISELRENLNEINKAFKRLTELKAWPAKGWVKSIEVTKGKDGVSAHPHLHILAMVQPSYFSHGYLSQARWVSLWQQCLRIDYQPVMDVRAVAKNHDPQKLIPEILKYQVKESDLLGDREWFLELTRQLHKTRAIAVGGILRHYMRELEEKNQDLIGENEETDEVEGGSLSFRWDRRLQKYKIE